MANPSSTGRRFFLALIGVTALPNLLLPVGEHLLAGVRSVDWIQDGVIFLGSSGHVAASFFFYGDARMRSYILDQRGRFLIAPLLVVAGTSAFFAGAGWLLPYGITIYWIWQTHHYTRQNHGILAFVARASAEPASESERTALTLSGVAGVIGMLTFVSPYRDTFLASYGWQIHTVALGTYVAGLAYYARSLWQGGLRGGPMRAAVLALLMLFYLPLFVYEDANSAVLSYAIAHGLQYLVFMSYVVRAPRASALRRGAALVGFVALGGGLLEFMQSPHAFGTYRPAVFGAYLGVVMWHFLLDAGVWRLSEPFQRGYMAERFAFLSGDRTPRPAE